MLIKPCTLLRFAINRVSETDANDNLEHVKRRRRSSDMDTYNDSNRNRAVGVDGVDPQPSNADSCNEDDEDADLKNRKDLSCRVSFFFLSEYQYSHRNSSDHHTKWVSLPKNCSEN